MVLRNSGRVGRRRVFTTHRKSPSHKDGLLCCVSCGWSKGRKGPKRACYGCLMLRNMRADTRVCPYSKTTDDRKIQTITITASLSTSTIW